MRETERERERQKEKKGKENWEMKNLLLEERVRRKICISRKVVVRGVIVTVVGNRHGDTSSNPGRDCISHSVYII